MLTLMCRLAPFESDANTRGRRSPFAARLTVCSEGATPDQTGAAATLMLMRVKTIATSRLQVINK